MFDAGTLVVAMGLVQLLLALSVLLYRKRREQVESMNLWMYGCIFMAVATSFMVMTEHIPTAPRVMFGVAFASIGLGLQLLATLRFFSISRAMLKGGVLLAVLVLFHLNPMLIHVTDGQRVAISSLGISFQLAVFGFVYGRFWRSDSRMLKLLTVSCVALSLAYLLKSIEAGNSIGKYSFEVRTPVQAWIYLMTFVVFTLNGIGFIFLLKEREDIELERQAHMDPLTETLNRRAFLRLAKRQLTFMRRHGQTACVIVCDIDHFKRVNDNFGHAAGDAVIRHLVSVANGMLRSSDAICRWGGEEFVMLLPMTALPGGQLTANRLRERLASLPTRFESKTIPVTMSAGVAELSGDETIEQLIARADQALYQAKSGGRNRVELALSDACSVVAQA